jgi:hypothetical protein
MLLAATFAAIVISLANMPALQTGVQAAHEGDCPDEDNDRLPTHRFYGGLCPRSISMRVSR